MATVEQAVRILNEALVADPEAVNNLFQHRVPCNGELAAHKTIQVAGDGDTVGRGGTDVSALGIINGIFGVDGSSWGAIAALYGLTCGCENTLEDAVYREPCKVCGETVDIGVIQKFVDNGRNVGH
jgi:hypothetical protein